MILPNDPSNHAPTSLFNHLREIRKDAAGSDRSVMRERKHGRTSKSVEKTKVEDARIHQLQHKMMIKDNFLMIVGKEQCIQARVKKGYHAEGKYEDHEEVLANGFVMADAMSSWRSCRKRAEEEGFARLSNHSCGPCSSGPVFGRGHRFMCHS